ncbi:MAG: 3-oxoacyl-[acyl-carrier-protein] reductase [Lachnospiraceae bacterium]|nr:3-oxoacyl-[acyl-carrier-protein] reductase [Lachnospiraceae bacterium]
MDIKGQSAIVTGASRGIGRAIAIELAKNGANVLVNYSGSEAAAKETAEECKKYGVNAIIYKADVSNTEEVNGMVEKAAEAFGNIDILVNNAGITRDKLVMAMTEEDFDAVININLKGTFNCTKVVSKLMMKQRYGRIINISSVIGVRGNAGQTNYAASKAGIIGLTKSVAKELASRNITVNAIAPGMIETDMTDVLSDKVKEAMLSTIPAKRAGKPEDIANAVAFLASKEASYITGQTICVDGGMAV